MSGSVSIIVPVYNTDDSALRRAVDSALRQEHLLEVILVDDGSDDATASAVDQLGREHPGKVVVVHKDNGGASSARNRGLDLARGVYIAFLDADDVLQPDFCAEAVGTLEERSSDVAFGAMEYVYRNGARELRGDAKLGQDVVDLTGDGIEALKGSLFNAEAMRRVGLSPAMYVSQCAVLYRRAVIAEVRFDERVKISEDRIFNFNVLGRCKRVSITGSVWYLYMENPKSASQTLRVDAIDDLEHTALALESLKHEDAAVSDDINLGIVECFQQTLYFSILRPGFRKAAGISERAYVRKMLSRPVYLRAFHDAKLLSGKQRILKFFVKHRLPGPIAAMFHLNKALFDLKRHASRTS